MWAQVYTELYPPNPQGFQLTEEERTKLQADNEKYNKPLPGETEILDKLAWDSPVCQWDWYTVTEVRDNLMLKPITTSQIGKVLKKLAERDERIMTKKPSNKSCYYLPPMDKNVRFYRHVDNFRPAWQMWTRWKTPVRRRRVKRVLGYIRLKIYIAEKADKVVVLLYYKKYRKNRKLL